MILNHTDGKQRINEAPEIYEGTNGTKLGRCPSRDDLTWPSGPWDTEPDVIAWTYKKMLAVLARATDGRWEANLFGVPPDSGFLSVIATEAELSAESIARWPPSTFDAGGGFDHWNLREYAHEQDVGFGDGLNVVASGSPPASTLLFVAGYITAKQKLSQLSRLIKAVNLDPWLRKGTYLATSFDNAISMVGFGARRIDVKEIIAPQHPQSETAYHIQDTCPSLSCFQTWDDRVLALTNKNDVCQLVDITDDPMAGLMRRAEHVEHRNTAAFLDEASRWFELNGVPGKQISIEAIDARMASEMALIDEALR